MLNKTRRYRVLCLAIISLLILAACDFREDDWPGLSAANMHGNEIYIAYGNFIARLDINPEDGSFSRTWVYPDDENRGPDFYAPAAAYDGAVYVGDYDGGVHAIDRATGERLWVYEQSGTDLFGFVNFGGTPDRIIGGITAGTVNDEPVVFVPDEEGIFALAQTQESEDAERLPDWALETERAVWSKPLYLTNDDQPARLYVTSLDQHLYAVDPADASVEWSVELGGAAAGTPTVFTIDDQIVLLIST
ncbi:MAG: PQQ-binding-like beta-propeller repeat protein, partial [Anaerolineales bacterium]